MTLANWTGVPLPVRAPLEGSWCRLEPLDPARHGAALFAASTAPGAEERFRYLFEPPPADLAAFMAWAEAEAASEDKMVFAVIDRATGRAEGRQCFMRIEPAHGVVEIGSILWGPAIARTRVATEALYLFAAHVFALGYRRFEWKCNDLNLPSKRAAARFGFSYEGLFRQHMVIKGESRDTAWFSIIDRDWPRLAAGYASWLAPESFDADGRQLSSLSFPPPQGS